MKTFLHTSLYGRAVECIVILLLFSYAAIASPLAVRDSMRVKRTLSADSLSSVHKNDLKLNDNAVKLIQFDFVPSSHSTKTELQTSPIDKPWMDFQVDLSVPKNMIDTTKVRKPENYVRMLPYSIWTKFGENPVFDVLVFGNKKRFEIMWKLDVDDIEEFGRNAIPFAGSYDPNGGVGCSSVIIGNLDFIGFIYDNFNKQGRIRKHNRKYANAWKTYQQAAPSILSEKEDMLASTTVGPTHASNSPVADSLYSDSVSDGRFSLSHQLNSVNLLEKRENDESQKPDYHLLQTPEQRSRFGTFLDPSLYAMPSNEKKQDQTENRQKRPKHKNRKHTSSKKKTPKQSDVIEELPSSMEDLYKLIRAKQEQDSIKRREMFRQDKTDQNAYELEQQQRRLKEMQN